MATTSKRGRRFQSFLLLRYERAARVTRACFSSVTDSAGCPASSDCLVRTSTNTIVSPSKAIRSISPHRLATPRPTIRRPFFFRKAAARCSPFLPSSPRNHSFIERSASWSRCFRLPARCRCSESSPRGKNARLCGIDGENGQASLGKTTVRRILGDFPSESVGSACFPEVLSTETRMRRLLLSTAGALAVLVGHAVLLAGERGDAPYSFSLNGESLVPRLTLVDGTAKQPAPGDVVHVWGFRMVLGPQRTQRYYYDPKEPRVLWIETHDHQRAPAAVRVSWEYKSSKPDFSRELANPLKSLTAEQIGNLRGVDLECWTDDLPPQLAKLDLQRVCVQMVDDSTGKDPSRIYPLPRSLRYLCVREHSNQGIRDWRGLLDFKELQCLDVEAMTVAFDCKVLTNASQLRHLSLHSWQGLVDPQ